LLISRDNSIYKRNCRLEKLFISEQILMQMNIHRTIFMTKFTTLIIILFLIHITQSFAQLGKEKIIIAIKNDIRTLQSTDDDKLRMELCRDIGNNYLLLEKEVDGIDYLKKSIEYADALKNYRYQYVRRISLAAIYLQHKSYDDAFETYKNTFKIILNNEDYSNAVILIDTLISVYEKKKEPKESVEKIKQELIKELTDSRNRHIRDSIIITIVNNQYDAANLDC
jgi:tetratricopeptide (TPR) repeat protein